MSDYKAGYSELSGKIYAGKVLKTGVWSSTKHEITDSAVSSVAYLLLKQDEQFQFEYQGKKYSMKVREIK